MNDQYAVVGFPVTHSKSPRIHASFALQTGQSLIYTAIEIAPGTFAGKVREFFGNGGMGLNVTVPFKEEAFALAGKHSPEASAAGAVNTLLRDAEGFLHGHNTDGTGLVRDIVRNHHGSLAGASVLVIGAGGATRGILLPLLQQAPARIVIANRTVSKACELADLMAPHGTVEGCGFAALAGKSFDWVINASAASLHGELPPLPASVVQPHTWCYDLMYGPEPTVFCRWATASGAAQVTDGLGMLVEQAAESFFLWRGIRPETGPVLAELKSQQP